MPNPPIYAGMGASGLADSPQLRSEIYDMSDPARRVQQVEETRQPAVEANAQQNLDIAFQRKMMGEMMDLNSQAADQIVKQARLSELDPDKNPEAYMKALTAQLKKVENQAKDVDTFQTGNVGAKNILTQVATVLRKRISDLQDKMVGNVEQPTTQPTTQPTQEMQ